MKMTIRVQEYGVMSYWPSNMAQAAEVVAEVVARNGCGNVQQRGADGLWRITHRYDRHYGMVAA